MWGINIYDIIVIGGGPAGALASKILALKGFKTLIIERKKEIGEPIQCGEALSEFALKDCKISTKEKWIVSKLDGVKSHLPNKKSFFTSVTSYSIKRKEFDKYLVKEAIDNGSEIKMKTIVLGLEDKEGIWNVKTTNGSYTSKVLIGADGPLSRTAQWLNLLQNKSYLSAFQYKFKSKDINLEDNNWLHMFWHEKFRGCYGWIFPRGEECNIGVSDYYQNYLKLNQFCKEHGIDHRKKIDINAGKVPVGFLFKKRSKPGALIIGDAACLTNPIMGGGIYAAMKSGLIGAETIIESFEKNDFSLMEKYDKKIKKTYFLHPYHMKSLHYFKRWTNDEWNLLGDVFEGIDTSDLNLYKMLKIGFKNPNLLLRSHELYVISKDMAINQKCI